MNKNVFMINGAFNRKLISKKKIRQISQLNTLKGIVNLENFVRTSNIYKIILSFLKLGSFVISFVHSFLDIYSFFNQV